MMSTETPSDNRTFDGMKLPLLSVVVAFRSGENSVMDCLDSLYNMDYPRERLEVIAIDDWHDDEISESIHCAFSETRLLHNAEPLGCDASKEIGIQASSGEIIALTDADCTVDPFWGRTIAEALCGETAIVTGPVTHPKTFLRELICVSDFPFSQRKEYSLTNSFPGCNFAARRQVFQSIEYKYNRTSALGGGSDRLLSWHLHSKGFRIAYDPRMLVLHKPAVDWNGILVRRRMYGSTAYMMRRIDPTLPGATMARLGLLAGPAYVCYKSSMDVIRLLRFTRSGIICPWHAPLLLPCLFLFRLLDAAGMTALQLRKTPLYRLETPKATDIVKTP